MMAVLSRAPLEATKQECTYVKLEVTMWSVLSVYGWTNPCRHVR